MKNNKIIVTFCCMLMLISNVSMLFPSRVKNTIVGNTNNFEAGAKEENILYIKETSGQEDIKNKYDNPNNPYILTVGEELQIYAQFSDSEYEQMKTTVGATVYGNDIPSGSSTIHIVTRGRPDTWDDSGKKLSFSFVGANDGLAQIVIHSKDSWGDAIESIYVRVIKADTIYVKNNYNGEYVQKSAVVNADVNEDVEMMAVYKSTLAMNGPVPSEDQNTGSGFWSWNMDSISFKNNWTKIENNRWLVQTTVKANKTGTFTLNLAKNGNGTQSTTNISIAQNKINIDNIKVGNKSYTSVNKNFVTKMYNGRDVGANSDTNRYIVYVGQTIDVSAKASGHTFNTNDSQILKTVKASSEKDGVVSASYKALKTGKASITLNNGGVAETLYIDVRNPIYVKTALGEYSKDNVHEYINESLKNIYLQHPDYLISDDEGTPLYVKNGINYFQAYYLLTGDTVILTTYLNKDDNTTFNVGSGIEIVPLTDHTYPEGSSDYVVVENLTGDMSDYKKVTAEFKLTSTRDVAKVTLGTEEFYVGVKNSTDDANHFDLETADGGTYTLIETVKSANGKVTITETVYNAYVSGIHGSKIYDASGKLVKELAENEYWIISKSNETQFESTSAYLTNEQGKLIDAKGNVIDDEVRNGLLTPTVKARDVDLANVGKVEFDADLYLVPVKKTITTETKGKDGKVDRVVKEEKVDPKNTTNVKNVAIDMNKRDIIDALNKCPDHTGLDLTTKIVMRVERVTENITNPSTGVSSPIMILSVIAVTSCLVLVYFKKKSYL